MTPKSMWSDYIEEQLHQFSGVKIDKVALEETQREATDSIRIRIKNNEIVFAQKSKDGMETTRVRGYLGLIQDVLAAYKIPDIDFIITLPDYAISYFRQPYISIPVFSFCRTHGNKVLLIPFNRFGRDEINLHLKVTSVYSIWNFFPNWGGVLEEIPSINASHPWEDKDDRCFFAGHAHDWNGGRIRFAEMSLADPEYFKAMITWLPNGHEHLLETPLKEIIGKALPMTQYPHYKFLLHIDGNTSSERLRYLLAFNSVVLKHDSPYEEFYFKFVKPDQHYVPVKADFSNLRSTIEALRNDDAKCRYITEEGMAFANNELSYRSVLTYCAEILRGYAEFQV